MRHTIFVCACADRSRWVTNVAAMAEPTRSAIRLARTAAVFGLEDVAAAAGVRAAKLKTALMSTAARGRCAEMARAALGPRAVTAVSCPPSAVRGSQDHDAADNYAGTAGWACRSVGQRRHPSRLRAGAQRWHPLEIARTADTSAPFFEMLIRNIDPHVRGAAAANPGCSEAMLRRFAGDEDADVRVEAAANPAASTGLLSEFAWGSGWDWYVKEGVARNPSAGASMLEHLMVHGETVIHEAISSNPAAPGWMLQSYATEFPYEEIRLNAFNNPSCPDSVTIEMVENYDG